MKISPRLRRTGDADLAPTTDEAPPRPAPPRGIPVAAYVGILDGHTLWLAVEPVPGTLALRDESAEVHPLVSDLPEQDPAYRSVRADLLDLPGEGEEAYDVVVAGSGRARTVWAAPFERTPMRTPPAPGGSWQFAVERTEDGMLRVRRVRPEPGCDVLRIDLAESGVRLTLAARDVPGDAEPALLGLEDGEVVATCSVERDGDALVATITEACLPEGRDQLLRWALGSAGSQVPLRRAANDLVQPNAAVLLPVLPGQDPDVPRLRMRWAPDGVLLGRVVDPTAEGGAA